MITALKLENYKSFKKLDLKLKKGSNIKKIVAIYGENGSGKSNIVSAFQNLILSLKTVNVQAELAKIQSQALKSEKPNTSIGSDLFLEILKNSKFTDTTLIDIFRNSYTFEENKPMQIRYDFDIDGRDGYYELIFNKKDGEIHLNSEKLYFLINKSNGNMFEIKANDDEEPTRKWSPSLFKKKEIRKLTDDATTRLWGQHTFLSIFNNIYSQTNSKYIKDNISSNFLDVVRNFNLMAYKSDTSQNANVFSKLLHEMVSGRIFDNEREMKKIDSTSKAINKYFVPLYSDIIELYYKTKKVSDERLEYELFERKRIGGKELEVPFRLESHGTRQLMDLFPLFLNAVHGETVVIDEIDQGIHDLLIDRLIENIKDDIKGQLIFTTHDTQVMKELDTSSLYVIQIDTNGNKKVVNLSKNSKNNIAAHNNVQKKYLEGYFAGIPYSDDVDFYDILNDLEVH